MRVTLSPASIPDYETFLRIKALPHYRIRGRTATFPDRYAKRIMGKAKLARRKMAYKPHPKMFDYQRDITATAIDRGKFSFFEDCGLGKTLQFLDYARHVARTLTGNQCILIVSPLMVISQTLDECETFYGGDLAIEQVKAAGLEEWLLHGKARIGITNYDALGEHLKAGRLACLILDESSMLKSHYGHWARTCLELGSGIDWKLAGTGTPAPNDRIEYANHAVFMDAFPSVNAFLARYFVNRGQTGERWELKPHALSPFYRSLSHWSIFLTNPATYGWKDNTDTIPPVKVHIHNVPMTPEQTAKIQELSGQLMATHVGGITSRSAFGQVGKGHYQGQEFPTNKPQYVRDLVDKWPDESTLIWCLYNREQERIAEAVPDAASITGATKHPERQRIIDAFKAGEIKTLISKPKILGFGLNLQIATRQIFSGLQDSYESYYQAVKRSNRYGSKYPLNVHIPVTDAERPMVANVLRKAHMIQQDTEAQEAIFRKEMAQ